MARIGRRPLRDLKVRLSVDFGMPNIDTFCPEFYADSPVTLDEHEEEEDLYDE